MDNERKYLTTNVQMSLNRRLYENGKINQDVYEQVHEILRMRLLDAEKYLHMNDSDDNILHSEMLESGG